jgi:hypothetical protein
LSGSFSKTEGRGRRRGGGRSGGILEAVREGGTQRLKAMFYGAMVWDPWLILAQIVCIQCLYYISLGILLYAFVSTQVPRFTLKYFFDYTLVTATSIVGWSTLAAFFVNALAG